MEKGKEESNKGVKMASNSRVLVVDAPEKKISSRKQKSLCESASCDKRVNCEDTEKSQIDIEIDEIKKIILEKLDIKVSNHFVTKVDFDAKKTLFVNIEDGKKYNFEDFDKLDKQIYRITRSFADSSKEIGCVFLV